MKLKSYSRCTLFSIALLVVSLCTQLHAEEDRPKKYEKLGTAKLQEFHMTKEQAAAADKSVAESFEQGFKNSSPEVQRAILKAAKEVEAKKKSKAEKSAEQ